MIVSKRNIISKHARFDIIIRTYNEFENLPRFYESIQKIPNTIQYNIIVLDSGSEDDTVEYLMEQLHTSVFVLKDEQFNYGKSLDYLVSLCKSEYVFSLSAHVYWDDPDIFSYAIKCMNDQNAIAGYFRQVPNKMTGCSMHEEVFLRKAFPQKKKPCRIDSSFNTIRFSNAGSFFKVKYLKKCNFGSINGSEDKIWAYKQLQQGKHIIYLGNKIIYHSHEENYEQLEKRIAINYNEQFKYSGKIKSPVIEFLKYFLGLICCKKRGTIRDVLCVSIAVYKAIRKINNGRDRL